MYTHNTTSTGRWNKRKQQQHFVYNEDPFAGMKASVDYQKEIERLKQTYKPMTKMISRSTTPDSSSSSESDISEVSEEDKLRFLAFIRSWTTGDWQKEQAKFYYTSNHNESFWSVPTPWDNPIKNHTPIPVKNHHQLPLPIGTGRRPCKQQQ